MKINIINLDKEGWILTKFAKKIFNGLKKKNHEVYLSKKPRDNVDVNHYIIFLFYDEGIIPSFIKLESIVSIFASKSALILSFFDILPSFLSR